MKRTGSPTFIKGWYKREKLPRKISLFFQDLKFCRQRIKYGWCDRDTWNMDSWFLEVIPPMLKHLRNNKHGHPINMTAEEWNRTLNKMICLFEVCRRKEEDEDKLFGMYFKENRELWHKELLKHDAYVDKCKNKAFEMFSKYFGNLWD